MATIGHILPTLGLVVSRGMTEEEIRNGEPDALAKFLDAGRNVQQEDVRVALANALRRIADLTTRLERLEHVKSP